MGGTVAIIIILLLFPVVVILSGTLLAGLIGWALHKDREDAYEGTEYVALGGYGPKADVDDDESILAA